MTPTERLYSAIYLYRLHEQRSKDCWDIYDDIEQAYFIFEYHHDMMLSMREAIFLLLNT